MNEPAFLPTDIALPYGLGPDGNLVSIDAVMRGLACECSCPGCGKPLIAKKGHIIRHHFAHTSDEACSSGFESMLHLLAKDIIARQGSITVPEVVVEVGLTRRFIKEATILPLTNVRLEQWLNGIRPDIIADVYGHDLIIEIAVTHKAEIPKLVELERRGAPAMEIDLSEFHKKEISEGALRSAIFATSPRYWLFNRLQHAAIPEVRAEEDARVAAEEKRQLEIEAEIARLSHQWARFEIEDIARREEQAAREAERRSKNIAIFERAKERLLPEATRMLGDEAEAWIEDEAAMFMMRNGPPSGLEYSEEFDRWCNAGLDKHYSRHLVAEKNHQTIRDNVLRVATAKFKDPEKARLWMTTSNPRVGGKPFEICIHKNGFERCKEALR